MSPIVVVFFFASRVYSIVSWTSPISGNAFLDFSLSRPIFFRSSCALSIRHEYRHRERQRTLAANARSNANDVDGVNHPGLGRMGEGVGYFPSLAALQFQSSVPGPSPSVAEYEDGERERLDRILWGMGIFALAYFLIS